MGADVTTYAFTPSDSQNFSFQPTLDGQVYIVVVWWNLYRQDWYISVYNSAGVRIVSTALVASPNDTPLTLVGGIFKSSLVYYGSKFLFEVLE